MKRLTLIIVSILIFFTTGCGNDSSSTSSTVSGVAAAGSPVIGQAWLKDYEGNFSPDSPVIVDGDGSFSFDVSGMKRPFFLMAKGNVAGNYYELYSVTFNPGRANINPLSHLACAGSLKRSPSAVFDDPEQSGITERSLQRAIDEIQRMLQPLLELNNAADADPIQSPFVADHTGLDAVLDAIDIDVDDDLNVTISNKVTGETLIQADAEDLENADDINSEEADDLYEYKTILSEVIAFVHDYWLTQSRSTKGSYVTDDYLHDGYDKTMIITNYPDYPDTSNLETLRHFTLTEKTNTDIYSLYYESVLTDGTINQNNTFVKKLNGQWFYCGNGFLYSVRSRSRGVKRVNVDGSIEYCAGVDFYVNDYAAQGIEMVTVDGPGLPETIKLVAKISGTKLDIISSQRTSGCITTHLYNMSDETILNELTESDLEYTLKAYSDYDDSTYAPVGPVLETRNISVSRRPTTRAELTSDGADYFALHTNLATHDISLCGLGDTVELQYTLPEGYVMYRGYMEMYFSDDDGHTGMFGADLELDNFEAALVTSAPSWTPTFAHISLLIYDGYDRMYKTQWDFE
jgi:hypothetical protein